MFETTNNLPSGLIDIGESIEPGFKPVLNFDGWRVAMLRYSEATDKDKFHQVEKHNLTYEVFVLTDGVANLIICEKGEIPGKHYILSMKLNAAYNIPPAVWHHIVVSEDAHVIIFEKADTTKMNSNYYQYSEELSNQIKEDFFKED